MKNQQEIATPKNASFEESQQNKESTCKKRRPLWIRLFFSGALTGNSRPTKKIAYVAVMAAFLSVSNILEIKFADIQFSFSIAASALAGVVLGAAFGFVAAFLGDTVGYLVNSAGYAYMPWVGLNLAVIAFLAGIVIGGIPLRFKGAFAIKITIFSILAFFIGTVGINTTSFWLLYGKGVPYVTYAITRIIVKGQIYNCLVNYALLYVIVPIIAKLKVIDFSY